MKYLSNYTVHYDLKGTRLEEDGKIVTTATATMNMLNLMHSIAKGSVTLADLEHGGKVAAKVRGWETVLELEDAEYTWLKDKMEKIAPIVWGLSAGSFLDSFSNPLPEPEIEEVVDAEHPE